MMGIETKQKVIKELAKINKVTNITNYSWEQLTKLKYLNCVLYSIGTYGVNGKLLADEDGNLYAITTRTLAIDMV